MVNPQGLSKRSVRRWGAAAGLLVLSACRSEPAALGTLDGEASIVTQVQMARPAADRVASSSDSRLAPALGSAALAERAAGVAAGEAPAGDLAPPPPDAIDEANVYCRQVEQQARETHAGLPKRLDRDTSATRVVAYGCDVVLEYAMHDLNVEDVLAEGVRALRAEVVKKLCTDGGARGVMNHGGSFTNVYRDQRSALIDQFTITAEDCASPSPADDAPVSFDL